MLICSKVKEHIFMFAKAEKQRKFKQFWIKNVWKFAFLNN